MSTRDPRGDAPMGVSAVLALVIGVVLFLALAVLGLGMLSYYADIDILSVPSLGQWPGIVGMAAAIAAFAGMLWSLLARPHPSFPPVILVGVVAAVVHVAAVWVGAALSGAGLVAAASAASQLVVQGSSAVTLIAAMVAAWIAVALRRTRAAAPRWPWERSDRD